MSTVLRLSEEVAAIHLLVGRWSSDSAWCAQAVGRAVDQARANSGTLPVPPVKWTSGPGEGSPTVVTKFNIEERWPELFAQLDETQRRAVVQSLASAWHEGWTPNREDVENLTDEARGAIDRAEYLRRVDAAAERRRKVAVAG